MGEGGEWRGEGRWERGMSGGGKDTLDICVCVLNCTAYLGMLSLGSLDSLASPPKMTAFCPTRLKE